MDSVIVGRIACTVEKISFKIFLKFTLKIYKSKFLKCSLLSFL